MKQSEFKRWLVAHGVEIRPGTNHGRMYYRGRQSTLPRHPGNELGICLRKAITRQLGL